MIDAITTHHEPLSSSAKMAPFAETPPGFTAFDTFVPFGLQLIHEGLFEPLQWVEKVTVAPAKVANMYDRWLAEAGWVLVNPALEWIITKDSIVSNGKNTPLINQVSNRESRTDIYCINLQ